MAGLKVVIAALNGSNDNLLNPHEIQVGEVFPELLRAVEVGICLTDNHIIDKLTFIIFVSLDGKQILFSIESQLVLLEKLFQLSKAPGQSRGA